MKKLSNFIVDKRNLIITIVLILAIVNAFLSTKVVIVNDMAEYLPDESSMRIGMDIMDEHFEEQEVLNNIRIMFNNLPDDDQIKLNIKEKIEGFQHVDSVSYKLDNADYNKENHTLYIISTPLDFTSKECKELHREIEREFAEYDMIYFNTNDGSAVLPTWVIMLAVAILMVILLVLSRSWVEPFIFLFVIGVAILLNLGTNIFLGSISMMTQSIAAILQLALSMDYSIMLINRYRHESEHTDNKYLAMKNALTGAFSAIASSSVTTIVGLLTLVFMNFKIGMDMGIVLAKGVMLSLVCIFTVLPALILIFDRLIKKTEKPVPNINMRVVSNFIYKFRYIFACGFVVLFVGSYILQTQTEIAYTYVIDDPINEYFPLTQTMVLLYETDDDEAVTKIAEDLDTKDHIKSAATYSTTLAKPYNSADLADALSDMGDMMSGDMDIDSSMLDIVYYHYYANGKTGDVTTSDFLNFIVDDVITNENFADQLNDDILDNIDTLSVFANKSELTTPKTPTEIADLFDMDEGDITDLFVYYYGKNGGVDTGYMTLPMFVNFIKDEVMTDEDFESMFDEEITDMIDTLVTLTNPDEIVTPKTSAAVADLLGIEADEMDLLFMFYYAKNGAADAIGLTFPEFAALVTDKILTDDRFDDAIDSDMRDNIDTLTVFASKDEVNTAYSSKKIADLLGMETDMADMLFMYYYAKHGAVDNTQLTFPQFSAALDSIMADEDFSDMIDDEMRENIDTVQVFADPKQIRSQYTAQKISDLLGIDKDTADLLFMYYFSKNGAADDVTLTFPQFAKLLTDDVLNDERFADMFDEKTRSDIDLLTTFGDKTAITTPKTSKEVADILDMDEDMAKLLYMYYFAENGGVKNATMTFPQFADVVTNDIMTNKDFSDFIDRDMREQMDMLSLFADKKELTTEYSAKKLAKMLDIDTDMVEMLMMYYYASEGEFDNDKMTIRELVNFLQKDVVTNPMFSGALGGMENQVALLSGILNMPFDEEINESTMITMLTRLGFLGDDSDGSITSSVGAFYSTPGVPRTIHYFISGMNSATGGQFQLLLDVMENCDYPLPPATIAQFIGQDPSTFALLYGYKAYLDGEGSSWKMTLEDMVNFIVDDLANDPMASGMISRSQLRELEMAQELIELTLDKTKLTAKELADIVGIDADMLDIIYAYYISEYGNTSSWKMSLYDMVDYVINDLAKNDDFGDMIDKEMLDSLKMAQDLMNGTIKGTKYTASQLAAIVDMDKDTLKLMYGYYLSVYGNTDGWAVSLENLVNFIMSEVDSNDEFGDMLDDEAMDGLRTAQTLMNGTLTGRKYTPAQLKNVINMDEMDLDMLKILYGYHVSKNGDTSSWKLSINTLVNYILDDLANDKDFGDVLDADMKKDLEMARSLINGTISGKIYTPAELAKTVDMEADTLKILYGYHQSLYGDTSNWKMSMIELSDFILTDLANDKDFGGMIDSDMKKDLITLDNVMNGTLTQTAYTSAEIAELMDMDEEMPQQLFSLYTSRHGDTSLWRLSLKSFVDFINTDVLEDEDLKDNIDEENRDMLGSVSKIIDSVIEGDTRSSEEMASLVDGLADDFDQNTVDLLYLYYFSQKNSNSEWTFNIEDMFNYLVDDVLDDPMFADYFDEEMRSDLLNSRTDLDDGIKQLRGEKYSRMIITSDLPEESPDTTAFITELQDSLGQNLKGETYLIGNAAMSYEMASSFDAELMLITILTAVSIYIVVALTFKSLLLPAILVLIIQCGVFVTISIIGLQGDTIYFLALLIVQSILMGATIDYGILFTTYFKEKRATMGLKDALLEAYNHSMHTILVSGLILIVVTLVLGLFYDEPTVSAICLTLSKGATCAACLIIFILPSILAIFDKVINRKIIGQKGED